MRSTSYTVLITESAVEDLRSIWDYVAQHDSRSAARRLIEGIRRRIESLKQNPNRGTVPFELQPLGLTLYRQILHGPIRIVYRVQSSSVAVLLIADGRRSLAELLEQRLRQ